MLDVQPSEPIAVDPLFPPYEWTPFTQEQIEELPAASQLVLHRHPALPPLLSGACASLTEDCPADVGACSSALTCTLFSPSARAMMLLVSVDLSDLKASSALGSRHQVFHFAAFEAYHWF